MSGRCYAVLTFPARYFIVNELPWGEGCLFLASCQEYFTLLTLKDMHISDG
jgi:hypothetical protein